jgi:ABC-type dipeptide/oligopeptide/nickel transport system permease component
MKKGRLEGIVAIFLILVIYGFNALYYQVDKEAFELSEDRIERELSALTSPRYQGHLAGSKENRALATYIEETLLVAGYESSIETVEVDTFKMLSLIPDALPIMEMGYSDTPKTYINFEDYRIMRNAYSGNIDYEGEVLFVKGSLSSLKAEEVAGKVIVTNLFANQRQTIDIARELGIRGILYATADRYVNIENRQLGSKEKKANDLFMATITNQMYEELEGIAKENGGRIPYGRIRLNDSYENSEGKNIIAKIQGQEAEKELYIVSHYDGKGRVGETFYPGASKNGAAMAIMFELAKVVHDSDYQPESTIAFVFLDGHELGNKGAQAFLDQHIDDQKTQEFIVLNDIGMAYGEKLFLNNSSTTIIPTSEANMLRAKVAMLAGDAGVRASNYGGSFSSEGIFAGSTTEYFAERGTAVVELKNIDTVRGVPFINTIRDTKEETEIEKIMDVATLLTHYIYYEGMGFFDLNYLIFPERFLINLLLLVMLIITVVNLLYGYNPSLRFGETTVRDVYLSVSYSVCKKLMTVIVPTVLMLFIMVCLLSIPHYTTSSSLGAGYTNYLPYMHVKSTFLYSRMLIFNGLEAMNGMVVEGMIIGAIHSFRLLSVSLFVALLLGIALGMRNGLKRSQIRTFMGLMVFSIPDVVISLGALYSIVYWFKDIFISAETLRTIVMPTFAMIIVPAIYIARIIEVAVVEERDRPYIYGALARGVSQRGVIWQHVFPKVLSKLFDTMGTVIRISIINLIVVEYIFSAIGIGNNLMNNYRDAFFVIYISFGFGLMYFVLTQFFKILSWRLNPMKRRLSS